MNKRLKRRSLKVGKGDVNYYEENERESILEAYSSEEIQDIFSRFDCDLKFVDGDYYKRFVCVI